MDIHIFMTRGYSTAQVAKTIGVSKTTLLRWLREGQIAEPNRETTFGGIESRVWSAADLERARRFKEEHYRKRS
jgi:DNA-binding transcriptional MerR regulator